MNANLQSLRNVLAGDNPWPEGFTWDYGTWKYNQGSCGCAGGLAEYMGLITPDVPHAIQAQELGLTEEQFQVIFFDAPNFFPEEELRMEDIQPHHVVQIIDESVQ